jgi:hypothetical protein
VSPGREESKLRNRLIFKLTRRWPASVAAERLSTPLRPSPHVERLVASIDPGQVSFAVDGASYVAVPLGDEPPAYGPHGRWTQLRRERDEARAEVERLRAALTKIASTDAPLSQDDMRIAREALDAR